LEAAPVRPVVQRSHRLVVLKRPAIEPQLLQVLPGLADKRTGPDAEQLHDRVAVEVGAYPGEVLFGRDPLDAVFEGRVVGRRLRVVQSDLVSLCSRGSRGPASVT